MLEKYCDIRYRDYLLDISRTEYTTGKFSYQGKSQDKDNIYFGGAYTDVGRVINDFIYLLDKELGEREKEEEILFCTIIYKRHELDIWLKDDLSYLAWIDGFDFASWGTWSIEEFVEVIEAFRKKVDSGDGESLIHTICLHKGYRLIVKKESELYIGTSFVHGEDWWEQSYDLDFLIRWFKSDVDEFSEEEDKLVNVYEYF